MKTENNNRIGLRAVGLVALGGVLLLVLLSLVNKLVFATSSLESESPFADLPRLLGLFDMLFTACSAVAVYYIVVKLFFRNTLSEWLGDGFDKGWQAMDDQGRTKTVILVFAVVFLGVCMSARGSTLPVSQKGIDLIVKYEVGGKAYYEKRLRKPTVPAWRTTRSGVTIGFGFDVGYNTKAQIRKACEGILSEREIRALQSVSGLKGSTAYYNLHRVKGVDVSWEEAEKIFQRDSLPRFSKLTKSSFNLTEDRLHPHGNGALVSLVFNRGGVVSYSNRRREMAWIRHNIKIGREDRVPGNIRSMKRLWSYSRLKGLHLRRDSEALLFQQGLDAR